MTEESARASVYPPLSIRVPQDVLDRVEDMRLDWRRRLNRNIPRSWVIEALMFGTPLDLDEYLAERKRRRDKRNYTPK